MFLRRPWDEAEQTYLDGTAIKTGPADWPFNPPPDVGPTRWWDTL
ncbi:hypothetical protein [Cryptosporangium sp. NPDC048952]